MTTPKVKLLILLLLIIGLGSCGQKDPPPVEDPPIVIPGDTIDVPDNTVVMPPQTGEPVIFDKDIIGKWELIAEGPDEERMKEVEADGDYREFLPNGEHKSSYWGDSKYTYQADSVFLYLYHAENPQNNFIHKYTIINRDTLKLKYVQGNKPDRADFPEIYIYKRITIEVPRDTVVMPPQTGEPLIFDKDIIGKWELIGKEHEENRIVPVETDGNYMEFLGNGVLLFFPSGYGETYQTDSVYLYRYFRYIDEIALPHLIYEYTLINRDTLKLKEFYSVDKRMLYPYLFIYQRKKE